MLYLIKHIKDRLRGTVPKGKRRSSKWPQIRAAHLIKNPFCVLCGGSDKLEVHHIVPFHKKPSLELNLLNLITLCESKHGGLNCHLAVGHLGNFKRVNPKVISDIKYWKKRLSK